MSARQLQLKLIPVSKKLGNVPNNFKRFDPEKNQPVAVMVGIRSCGGLTTAKCQLHRGRAYFDTWLRKYPEERGDFSRHNWGSI